jgi:polyhydroxybutyrate depolymerase
MRRGDVCATSTALLFLAACGGGTNNVSGGSDATVSPSEAGEGADATSDGGPGPTTDGSAGDAGGSDGGDAGTDASCSGKTATRRGLTNRSMAVAGLNRTYLVYLPPSLDPNQPAPLVYVHHGWSMSGQAMHDITGYSTLADREGIAVAFPDGEGGPNSILAPWNVGTGVCGGGAVEEASGDDFSFLEAMKADIQTDQCIDAAHIFVTGFSMGGYFANQVGCMRPDLARAVAAHSGGTHDFSTCVPGHKPVIIFHGTADPVIAEMCGTQARDYWVAKNGCSTDFMDAGVEGGDCEYSAGCPADGQVALCLFNGLGHAWAGGAPNMAFSDPNFASATELQWSFYKTYAW